MRFLHKTKYNIFFVLGLIVPIILTFRFLLHPHAWGDAPYFYGSSFDDLLKEPQIWVERGNILGGINNFIFIYPLMIVLGLLNKIFGFGSNTLLDLLFYFPAIIFSTIGPILLVRHWQLGKSSQFFAALIYSLNTYFLLLIDGGVAGVALAHGIFPFSILTLLKLTKKPSYKKFVFALITNQVLIISDPRIAIISFISFIFLETISFSFRKNKLELKSSLFPNFFLFISLFLLNLYWILPLFKLQTSFLTTSNYQTVDIRNVLTIFQPHWPQNIFGVTSRPLLYFYFFPILIFLSFFLNIKNHLAKNLFFAFLFFAFLVTGIFLPYISKIPFNFAFRDSTKFFIPLTLFSGISIGLLCQRINNKFFNFIIYLYLIFLISPAILGNLNFTLSNHSPNPEIININSYLSNDKSFFRSAWFPEVHPQAFQSENFPALNAKFLVNLRPLARINAGSSNLFNFLINNDSNNFLDIYGIKYLILSDNQRIISKSSEEYDNWQNLIKLLDSKNNLTKLSQFNTPVYENQNNYPKIFGSNRLIAVVGSDDVYDKSPNFAYSFFEDGMFDPSLLNGLSKDSVSIYFNNKKDIDLTMSFLQSYFISTIQAKSSQWSRWTYDDYLYYKYQLLIRDINYKEFDYKKGIALSSQPNETISFNIKVPKNGDYILAIRSFAKEDSNPLTASINNSDFKIDVHDSFSWFTTSLNLKKGISSLQLTNKNGTQILNVIALVPKTDFDKAIAQTKVFENYFQIVNKDFLIAASKSSSPLEIKFKQTSPTKYEVQDIPENVNWIFLSTSYNPKWQISHDFSSKGKYSSNVAISSLNIFPKQKDLDSAIITFEGQKDLRWGIYWSTVSLIAILIVLIWLYPAKHAKN